jgi:hypothetical protein
VSETITVAIRAHHACEISELEKALYSVFLSWLEQGQEGIEFLLLTTNFNTHKISFKAPSTLPLTHIDFVYGKGDSRAFLLNEIINRVDGYLYLLDSDDNISRGALAVLSQEVEKNSSLDFILGQAKVINYQGLEKFPVSIYNYPINRVEHLALLSIYNFIPIGSFCIHKRLFSHVEVPLGLDCYEDYFFLISALNALSCFDRVSYIRDILFYYWKPIEEKYSKDIRSSSNFILNRLKNELSFDAHCIFGANSNRVSPIDVVPSIMGDINFNIDNVFKFNDRCFYYGWAFSSVSKIERIYLESKDLWWPESFKNLYRPDVAHVYGMSYLNTGFCFSLPESEEVHSLIVKLNNREFVKVSI